MAEYTKINHPVAGEIEIRTDKLEQMTPAELNNMLVEHVANQLKEQGVELSSFDAFTGQAFREFTSTSRGIQERLGADTTTSYEDDFMSEVAFKTNPTAAWSGLIAGAILDPITFLNPFAKAAKVARIAGGIGTGALAGFLTPVREEFGESTAITTGAGAGIGGTIAAVSPTLAKMGTRIAKKLGYDSEKAMQDAFETASEEERKQLQEQAQQAAQEEVQKMNYEQGMPQPAGQTGDFVPQVNPVDQAQELARIRAIGDEAEAARIAQQQTELERIRQVGRDEELARIRRVGEEFVPEDLVKKQVDEMRTTLPSSKEASVINKEVGQLDNFINKLNARIDNLTKAYNKTSSKKRTPESLNAMQTLQKQIDDAKKLRAQRQGERQSAAEISARLNEQKQIQKEIAQYDKDGTVPSFVKINKPDMTRAEADAAMAAKANELQPPVRPVEQPQAAPVPPQQVAPEMPVQRMPEAPMAQVTATPTAINTLNPHRSASSAATGGLSDQEIKNIANLDMRTKEAKALEGETRIEKQLSAMDELGKRESQYYQADEIGGKITWEKVGREAEWIESDVADAVNAGNYRNAADWVLDTLRKQNNQLGPAQWAVAQKVFAVAERNIEIALQNIKKLEGNDGNFTAKMTAELNGIQNDQALMDVVRQMDALRKGEAGAKASWSAVGRELKRIKRLSDEQYKEYRNSNIVRSIILGVKCK